ncbi:MAG: hypothetical protein COB34_08230 [Methylophilaceae bacterium]|nr:MAG: hypothetical protein COB34_08230 [Methylophilaceae bacterium]
MWDKYHQASEGLEQKGDITRPTIPEECQHNAHMYYILLDSNETRTKLIETFKKQNIHPVFHYIPLHSSPGGLQFGRVSGAMTQTNDLSARLLRLPLWVGLKEHQDRVLDVMGLS